MSSEHYELRTTLRSIDDNLNIVNYQLKALDNRIDSLEKKMAQVLVQCLGKQSMPFVSHQSRSMPGIIDEQDVQLEIALLNGGGKIGSDSNRFVYYGSDEEDKADKVQDISNNLEVMSFGDDDDDDKDEIDSGTADKDVSDFLTLLQTPKCCPNSSLSYTSTMLQNAANDEAAKKPKLYASQVLELVGNFIQVTERQEYIQHYNAVIKFLINALKTDDVFKSVFRGEVMAGSYRDGLKISKPNEFDTILRLNFGDKSNLIVEKMPTEPAHVTIKVQETESKAKSYLNQFLDSEGYLLQDVIIIWIQNLFRRILKPIDDSGKIIQIGNNSYHYTHSINGPAFTFKIAVQNSDIKFDMDLVPAIPFDFDHWIATRNYPQGSNQIKWIAVPKPPKGGVRRPNRSFICSYTEMEKDILHDINQAKNLIRIFKKLRDTQQLKYLKSYFIKTIFLWQFDNTTVAERKAFWSRSLDIIFLDMFKIILDHIQKRELIFYWETDYNMFDTIAETKLKSWDNKLRGIYSRLKTIMADNPRALLDIILTPDEKLQIECKHPKLCLN